MSEKCVTVQDFVEALENFPLEPNKITVESTIAYYSAIDLWKKDFGAKFAKLKKQLQDTSEKEVDRINDLIREKAKTIHLVSRDEKTAFVCGFKIGHSTRTQELLGRNKP